MEQFVNMTAPWYVQQQKLKAFFALDEDVTVGDVTPVAGAEAGEYFVEVKVKNRAKSIALTKKLRKEYDFGGVKLHVVVIECAAEETVEETLKDAFAHNRMVRGVVREDANGFTRTFVVVEAEPLQFKADNLADYRRNVTMLASDVAAELFDVDAGVSFCAAALDEN